MISKRTRRYSQPQEQLRQFALNNSKGIDETKPIVDHDTVLDTVNLTVNDDGSMSLRKPLRKLQDVPKSATDGDVLYTIPLFDEAYRMVVYSKEDGKTMFKIFDSEDSERSVRIESDDYYTYSRYVLADSANPTGESVEVTISDKKFLATKRIVYSTVTSSINLSDVTWTSTPTSTIINGAKILLSTLSWMIYPNASAEAAGEGFAHADSSLYDAYIRSVPRRLIVTECPDTNNDFCIIIHTPEIATIVPKEDGRFDISANLMLDYPYAIRDVYNASVPRIKGIAFYKKDSYIQIDENVFLPGDRFSQMFESTKSKKYRMVSTIARADLVRQEVGDIDAIIKAFCDIPADGLPYAARWSYSFDGVTWDSENTSLNLQEVFGRGGSTKSVQVPAHWYNPTAGTSTTVEKIFHTFRATSSKDVVFTVVDDTPTYNVSRPDVLVWRSVRELLGSVFKTDNIPPIFLLRFEIVKYSQDSSGANVNFENMVATQIFEVPLASVTEYATSPKASASEGKIIYYKKALYSFGAPGQGNLIYASDVGSNITLLSNIIDLNLQASGEVTAVVPWREYLIAFTTHAVFLLQKADEGFYSKTINAAFGVSKEDSKCVVASLNGVFLKHDDCVYFTYPNLYASTDNVMQFTDVSKPVRNILQEHFSISGCFATLVQEKYVLLAPGENYTECLIYDIAKRSWEHYKYPIKLSKFQTTVANGTVVVVDSGGYAGQYHIFKEFEDTFGKYADKLNTDPSGATVPIQFSWDTGQKTDNIAETKQFVESKLMFATLSDTDAFPFTLYVAIDGDPHVTKKDIGTDAPFWKPDPANTSDPTLGVLNTSFRKVEDGAEKLSDSFNVLRQLVVRYSGKGKSIRHLIEGESQSNFKLYETYVRYKSLSNK